jgi:excisionase family DNA binding protein
MKDTKAALSVTRVAAICGVGRTTVGYWIRSKKLRANRLGRNYSIPVEELLFFLKTTGQKIPKALSTNETRGPYFRTIQNCWSYWEGMPCGENCRTCPIFAKQLELCFTARSSYNTGTCGSCQKCSYYQEIYLSRIAFVHQISVPAAIYRDLYFWGGNSQFATMCQLSDERLVGLGIEQIVHAESLSTIIASVKKRALGTTWIPDTGKIFFKNSHEGKTAVPFSVFPLDEPEAAYLVIAEPSED